MVFQFQIDYKSKKAFYIEKIVYASFIDNYCLAYTATPPSERELMHFLIKINTLLLILCILNYEDELQGLISNATGVL